ncbi:hypothetical protein [Pyrococcus sp. ST04]|uniref:hypothetical protein n=1 Tax=Pyrococcus sp. ST04 TaxID=1183377 RepID=UPI000260586B|nr:hypothetical protein [Pyrococcus sp. ST04]AFK21612.1 hypothetical protein Py04_0005 [Pyrococcus sp. ST04]
MKGRTVIVISGILLTALFIYYTTNAHESWELQRKELFISNITGYVAGYLNETISLNVYWIKVGDTDFNATIGVRGLPSCLGADGVSLTGDYDYANSEIKEIVVSVKVTLKESGHCIMKDAYLEIKEGNQTKKVSLGNVEFEILEPTNKKSLKIKSYIGGSVGPEPSIPTLMYTLFNPFNESVEILNVTFDIPGLQISNFKPREIPPGKTVNLTITLVNTTELGNLYVIKPLIVYRVGEEIQVIPAETYYYATIPGENTLLKMFKD